MFKNKLPRQKPSALDPGYRNKNFEEVELEFTKEQALQEASRCLKCKKPLCVNGCPVSVDIPGFIEELIDNNIEKAGNVIRNTNMLPSVCGRVCPQERQCEAKCILGIKGEPVAIGALERYVGDKTGLEKTTIIPKNQKVAIVGSGPAGITAASELAREGYNVTIFEALHDYGGVLRYGIPEFRLPRKILDKELKNLKEIGVKFERNVIIGRTLMLQDLFEQGYEAVFIGAGAGLPWFLGIPGENLNGVYSANEFLTRVNLMKAHKYPEYRTPIKSAKKVVIIGGGNTAMDAARVSKRLGCEEVTVAYRRSEKEMPARRAEYEHAIEEGINFLFLHSPIEIEGKDGFVSSVKLQVMELGEPDESGRRRPQPIEGKTIDLELDTAIIAIGTSPNPILVRALKSLEKPLEVNKHGYIVTNKETCETSMQGVFAGGDIAPTSESNVINAMGAGRVAAKSISSYLKQKG